MDEGGGGLGYADEHRLGSTNGGATWSSVNDRAGLPGPGCRALLVELVLRAMYPLYWRHMGWGDIAVGPNNSVHYAYASHGTGERQGRHLLRALDRQRRHLERSAPAGRRRWDARAVAALAGGHAGGPRVRQLVRPAQHGERRPAALRSAVDRQRRHLAAAAAVSDVIYPVPTAARPEHPALLHGRLRPLASALATSSTRRGSTAACRSTASPSRTSSTTRSRRPGHLRRLHHRLRHRRHRPHRLRHRTARAGRSRSTMRGRRPPIRRPVSSPG